MVPLDYERKPAPRSPLWMIAIIGAWLLGVQLYLVTDRSLVRSLTDLSLFGSAVGLCFFRPFRDGLFWLNDRLERRGRLWTPGLFLVFAAASVAFLYTTAIVVQRKFYPVFHDEFSYMIQTQMLARGHLALPPHPLADFFESFYLITDRAYASQYFPGAALMFVPGVWAGWPHWVMPLIVTGAACGMMFLVIRELFDGLCGLASVIVLLGTQWTRFLALSPNAQEPALLLVLIAIFAVLRWIATSRRGWIVVAGTAMGWMAITRPVDAAVYGIALLTLLLVDHLKRGVPRPQLAKVVLAGILPMLPFLGLQLATNRAVTGSLFQTPFAYYAQRDMPGTAIGFRSFDESAAPVSTLPQKKAWYEQRVKPLLANHTPAKAARHWLDRRARIMATEILPDLLLIVVFPAALLTMRDRRRWTVVGAAGLWCVVYSFYVFDFAHYYVLLLPGAAVLVFAGFESVWKVLPRAEPLVRGARLTLTCAIAVMAMPQFSADLDEQFIDSPLEAAVRRVEASLAEPRSILLVKRDEASGPHLEAVFNVHTAWPDDARVIRAHDLGERNIELYRYYANVQPQRIAYRYDVTTGSLMRLGNVTDLARP